MFTQRSCGEAGNELRAVALINLGTVEASLGLADAERHLRDSAVLARKIGRPYLEVRCLVQLGFASRIRPFATVQRRCREACWTGPQITRIR
jgi:LuxR family transcriptional regulator, maltose regulon positive regulatory protein